MAAIKKGKGVPHITTVTLYPRQIEALERIVAVMSTSGATVSKADAIRICIDMIEKQIKDKKEETNE